MKKIVFFLFVLIIMSVIGYSRYNGESVKTVPENVSIDSEEIIINEDDFAEMEPIIEKGQSLAKKMIESNPPISPLEQTRNATVFISTPWGNSGAGFFMNGSCNIVTHRTLFEIDTEKLLIQRKSIENSIDTIKEEINQLQEAFDYVIAEEGVGERSRRIDIEMHQLARLEKKFTVQLDKLGDINTNGKYKVILFDGSEYDISGYVPNNDYSIAFIKLPEEECPHTANRSYVGLQVNQTLMTLSNDSNAHYAIENNVYVGNEHHKQGEYITFDSPETHPMLGGPVLDEFGYIIGLRTTLDDGNKGRSYALPIRLVEEVYFKYHP